MSVERAISAYYGDDVGEHARYRSWEHCYRYFRRARREGLAADRDHAALQLGFYLASWGMYRGSSFLLQHAYTVHRGVIDLIAGKCFDDLWNADFGARETDGRFIPLVHELVAGIRREYKPFAPAKGSGQPTDTLITKVILGTFGCLPACDQYFAEGFKSKGFQYPYLNDKLVERVLAFCQANLPELQKDQARIEQTSGLRHPLMKLVDMYFWQIGREKSKGLSIE